MNCSIYIIEFDRRLHMNQENTKQPKRQFVFNKTIVLSFSIGFVIAALLATASILIFLHPLKSADGNDDFSLDTPLNLGGTLLPLVTDFESEVIKASEPVLLLIVSDGTNISEMIPMAESLRIKWEYKLKQYEVGSGTQQLQELGIDSSELPIFAFMYQGKLLGKQKILQVIKDIEVINWASTIVSKKVNAPVIYRMVSDTYTVKNAYIPDDYVKGELSLFPFSWTVKGYKKCVAGNFLKAYEDKDLYEMLGAPALNKSDAYSLPVYPGLSASTRENISYSINLEGYIPRGNSELSTSSVNGITYIAHPIDLYERIHYLGEIVLGKFLDQEDLNRLHLMPCDGRELKINSNQALFSLLSTTYGGDGSIYFALPDLSRAEVPFKDTSYYICYSGIWPSRAQD